MNRKEAFGDWIYKGNCISYPGDVMFPTNEKEVNRAKGICDGCPVKDKCLEFALTTKPIWGVLGGIEWKNGKPKKPRKKPGPKQR